MSKCRLVASAVVALVVMGAGLAAAEDIAAKKILIKDKRQIQLLSVAPGVQFSKVGDLTTSGAVVHVYSATDDFCMRLPSDPQTPPSENWANKGGKAWKYKNKATKNSGLVKNGKLVITIKSGVGYTLADQGGTQGTVNAVVRFGNAASFCMRCTGKKDTAAKFLGKNCAAAPCDPEPSTCPSGGSSTTTTTTMPSSGGRVLKGALIATAGRFNYNLTLGLPGANSACNTSFAGTHPCTVPELQSAAAAGDLAGLNDTGGTAVTAFWAIDPSLPALEQCQDDASGGSSLNWEYGTAHTASRGRKVPLTNATGELGALGAPTQCNFSTAWVGCCQ